MAIEDLATELSNLEKGLLILKELAMSERPLVPSEIANLTGLNRSTTYRLCETLERSGWVARIPTSDGDRGMAYDIGFAAHGVAVLVVNKYDTASKLDPLIRELARTLNETVHIGALDGDRVVHVARALPDDGPNLAIRIGAREYAHTTALGKAMLAALPRETLEGLYHDEHLPRRGPHALGTRSDLFRELEAIPARGFALSIEESRAGVGCVGAPLFGPDGFPVFAISVTASTGRFEGEGKRELAAAVMAAAVLATASLGGRAPAQWAQGTDAVFDATTQRQRMS